MAARANTANQLHIGGVTSWLPLLREVTGTPSATVHAAMKAARSLVASLFWICVRTSSVIGKSHWNWIVDNMQDVPVIQKWAL